MPKTVSLPAALVLLLLALVLPPPAAAQFAGPEPATTWVDKPLVRAGREMAVAANPLASEAGLEMLRRGGSAVDAAIAAQLVLGLVEPQSSGIGGGAFIVVARPDGTVTTFDGRETAPAGTRPDRFVGPDGKPMPFLRALDQGRAVGTPGAVAVLALAHGKYGKLPWKDLFDPAIRLAEEGFPTPLRLAEVLERWRSALEQREDLRRVYYHDGAGPLTVGETFRNPDYAATLRLLAAEGPAAFYTGPLAGRIADRLTAARGADGPAVVTREDLAGYRAVERPAVCGAYRVWTVCGMAPPSSGGIAVLQILGMLEPFDLAGPGPDDPRSWHLLVEAMRRAYADREVYLADPDQVAVPVRGLLDRGYLADRSAGIDPARAAQGKVPAGNPPWREGTLYAPEVNPDVPGTSHLSTVDADGMAVAMTTTVESAFGSGLMVGGFVLNNQLTDFSFLPERDGRPVANAPGPGKRPLSSMSPTVVLDRQGRPVLTVGSPGGSAIIAYVAQAVVAMLDWNLDPQVALAQPRVVNRNGATLVEAVPQADALAGGLVVLGHQVERRPVISGLHAIRITPDGLLGGADPRRDGLPKGD